ncbi:hypothetical protein VCB98_11845, partial [Gammaproteobacteria bacterium AB-CW1]|nr:hypothetical protein [Gammaproteobacteria bacterium AB-CW1]
AFKLIEALAGKEFDLEPMAGKVWSRRFFANVDEYKEYVKFGKARPGERLVAEIIKPRSRKVLSEAQELLPYQDEQFARRLRQLGKPYFWQRLPDTMRLVEYYVSGMRADHDVWDVLDREAITSVLLGGVDYIESSKDAKNLLRLAAGLVWLNCDEVRHEVNREVSV